MGSIVLKIDRVTENSIEQKFYYKDIDAFSDKYAVSKVDLLTDVSAVKAAIRNIFMWTVGEEILFPKFGNNVRKFLYQPLDDVNKNELAQEIKRSIEENEPRVVVENCGITQREDDQEHSIVTFVIAYHVIGNKILDGQTIRDTITIGDKTINVADNQR